MGAMASQITNLQVTTTRQTETAAATFQRHASSVKALVSQFSELQDATVAHGAVMQQLVAEARSQEEKAPAIQK
eukprot:1344915-Alexandrium_andersonii.AAC.1